MMTTLRKLLVSTLALTSCSGSSSSSSLRASSSKYNMPSDNSTVDDKNNAKIEMIQNKLINSSDIIRVQSRIAKRENDINIGMSSKIINHKASAFHRLMKSKRNDVITTTSNNARRSLLVAANNTNSEDGNFNSEKNTPSSTSSSSEVATKKIPTNNSPKPLPQVIDPTIIVEFTVGLDEMDEILVDDFFTEEKQQESDALLRATARVLCENTNFKITTNYVANQRDICWAFSRQFHNHRHRRATTHSFARNHHRLRHHHHRRRRLDTAAGGDATTLIIDLDNSLNYVQKVINKKNDDNLQWFHIGISYEVELFGKHVSSETEGMRMALLTIQKMAQKAISQRIDDDTFKDMLREDIPTVVSVSKAPKSSDESSTNAKHSSSATTQTTTTKNNSTSALSFITNIDPLRLSGCILFLFTISFSTLIFHLGTKRLRRRRHDGIILKETLEINNTPHTRRFSSSSNKSELSRLFHIKNHLVSTRHTQAMEDYSDISASSCCFVAARKSLGIDFERVAVVPGSKCDYSRRANLEDEEPNSLL